VHKGIRKRPQNREILASSWGCRRRTIQKKGRDKITVENASKGGQPESHTPSTPKPEETSNKTTSECLSSELTMGGRKLKEGK